MPSWSALAASLDHWQSLIAGLAGAGAAIVAVVFTLRAERRRRDQEATAITIALGAEIRQRYYLRLPARRDLSMMQNLLKYYPGDRDMGEEVAVWCRRLGLHRGRLMGGLSKCEHSKF
jgi:hypothetical protein